MFQGQFVERPGEGGFSWKNHLHPADFKAEDIWRLLSLNLIKNEGTSGTCYISVYFSVLEYNFFQADASAAHVQHLLRGIHYG